MRPYKSMTIHRRQWTSIDCSDIIRTLGMQRQAGKTAMNENETLIKTDDLPAEEKREIANMDEYDFLNMLPESRIWSLSGAK